MTIPVVLITGASRGLGRGIALELAHSGCHVAINFARNADAAGECATLCRQRARSPEQRFVPIQADIGDSAARAELLQRVEAEFGRLDALVNNAGIAPRIRADLLDSSEESFEQIVRTNLHGPHFLTQAVARRWVGASTRWVPALPQGFTVIFVTSISANTASVARGDYCISKAGLSMSAKLWATRLAAESICVYEVRPGIMQTDMTSGVSCHYDDLLQRGLVPQMRWGTPTDVGKACRALLEGSFPFSTGTTIDVDGGFQLRRL